MSEPGEPLNDGALEVTVVRGDGRRRAVMLRDPRTEQSVLLMLSGRRDADRAFWFSVRRRVGNPALRNASDKVVDDAAERPGWDEGTGFETLIPEDPETAHQPGGESRQTSGKWRWWPGTAMISGTAVSLAAAVAFFDMARGTPFNATAAGWTGAVITGVSILSAATVISYAVVLVARMRETSVMAADLASARQHLNNAAENLTIVRRFRDLKSAAG